MPLLDVLGYIAFGITWILAVTWAYGVRVRPVILSTINTALSFLVLALAFTFSELPRYHLLWLTPIAVAAQILLIPLQVRCAPLREAMKLTASLYAGVLRFGRKDPLPLTPEQKYVAARQARMEQEAEAEKEETGQQP